METYIIEKSEINLATQVFLKFNQDLNKLKSGEEINLSFSPRFKDDEDMIANLETIHERKAHIIIVSDDLDYFSHIHPSSENNEEYVVQLRLPYGGNYKMFIEYKPVGGEKITENFELIADGGNKQEKIFDKERLLFRDQNLNVNIQNSSELFSEGEAHIPVTIIKSDKEISANNLDNYLGEKALVIMIGLTDKELLHVHPMVTDNNIYLHLNFKESDFYRLWVQFQLDGVVYTADFVLNVKPSEQTQMKLNSNHHNH